MSNGMLTKGLTAPDSATPVHAVKIAPEGIVVAIVAVTGVVDAVDDLIVPGAFAHTLTVRKPKVVFQHQWTEQCGRTLHVEEWMPGDPRLPSKTKDGHPWPAAAGALVATMQYNLRSARAAEAYEMVRFYAESNEAEFSIGYKVPDGKARKRRDGVRVILMVDLYEFSHVLFGAAPLSMALDVKSMHSGSGGTVAVPTLGSGETDKDNEFFETQPPPIAAESAWDDDQPTEQKSAAQIVADARATAPAMEGKSMTYMSGSLEERQERIRDAVHDLFCKDDDKSRHTWVCVRATFDTEVVVTVEREGEVEETSYIIGYKVDPDGAVELDAPTEVTLHVVAKMPNANDEVDEAASEEMEAQVAEAMAGQIMSSLVQVKSLAHLSGVTSDALLQEATAVLAELEGKGYPPPVNKEETEEQAAEPPEETEAAPEAPADAAPAETPAPDYYPSGEPGVEDAAEEESEEAAEGGDAEEAPAPIDETETKSADDDETETKSADDDGMVYIDADEHFKMLEDLDVY